MAFDGTLGNLLTCKQAAARVKLSEATMRRMRGRNEGPPYVAFGHKKVFYPELQLDQWMQAQLVFPSS